MRRLSFFLSCGVLAWILLSVRSVAPTHPASSTESSGDTETLVHRSQVVSTEFTAAFLRAQRRVQHANDLLNGAAHRLDALAGR